MAANSYIGGTYGPGQAFEAGDYFEGCTFIAPCTFPAGCNFVGCTFKCNDKCKNLPCKCCPDVSTVGVGAVATGCSGDHVTFETTSTTEGFSDTGCGLLTLPGCVDCAPRPSDTNGPGISTAGTEVVVSDRGVVTQSDWCKGCGQMGAVIQPDAADVAPKK